MGSGKWGHRGPISNSLAERDVQRRNLHDRGAAPESLCVIGSSIVGCGQSVDENHLNVIRTIDPMADLRRTYGFIKAINHIMVMGNTGCVLITIEINRANSRRH